MWDLPRSEIKPVNLWLRLTEVDSSRIHLPMQETEETRVQSLGQGDPLEEEMATYSSILAWRIPWTEEPGGPTGLQKVEHNWAHTYTHSREAPLLLLKSEKKSLKQLLFLLCFFPDHTHLKVLHTFKNLSCIFFFFVFAIPFCLVIQTVSRPSP